jgi:soluble lytic murein transglycosylase-like protein
MNFTKNAGVALLLSLLACQAWATDVATLRNGFTIRHESRAPLGNTTRLFLTSDGSSFVDVPTAEIVQIEHDPNPAPAPANAPSENVPAPTQNTASPTAAAHPAAVPLPSTSAPVASSPADVSRMVSEASGRYRLDPDLVNSVIRAESGFKVHAISPKGAQGLMQLMPQTASKLGVPNAFDPEANVDGGTRYLRELLEKYNYDLIKALAAYNAGPQRVEQYGGVPPYRETRHYVASIVRDFNRKKLAQQKAASGASPKPQLQKKTLPQKQAKALSPPKPARVSTQTTAKKIAPPTGN